MPAQLFLMIVVGGYCAFYYGDESIKAHFKNGLLVVFALLAVRWTHQWIAEWNKIGIHRERIERLQAFANELTKGELDARGFYSGGTTTVCGQLEGRQFQALVRLGRDPYVTYDVKIKDSAAELDAVRPGLFARLQKSRIPVSWRGAPVADLDGPLAHLLVARGLHHVSLHGGWLRAEAPLHDSDLRLDRLLDVCRTLGRIARLCERDPARDTVTDLREKKWTSSYKAKPLS